MLVFLHLKKETGNYRIDKEKSIVAFALVFRTRPQYVEFNV
jgi:hypothetical protein